MKNSATKDEGAPRPPGRVVALLSGGLDSATAAAWAIGQGWTVSALTVDYGQRHAVELDRAMRVASSLGIEDHVRLSVDLAAFGASALVDASIPVPMGRSADAMQSGIPSTYVPARNTVLLALALAMAESRDAAAIVLGVNAIDYSGYPDCRPEFIDAFRALSNLATRTGVEGRPIGILAPLQTLSKAEIIRLGISLGVDYSLTTSCYQPSPEGRPCGGCDACLLRAAGFLEAGRTDPVVSAFPERGA